MANPLLEAEVTRSIRLAPNYSDWTKARLIERLEKLQSQIDKREAVGFA